MVGTLFAYTFIIMVYLLHRVSLQGLFHRVDGWGESRQVVDVSALFAEEVGMGLGQGVVAGVPLVDGERLDSTVVALVLHARRRASSLGLVLDVRNEPAGFRELVHVYGLDEMFATPRA